MQKETAYAKVNLALHVRRRREDGFHDIESLFAFAEDGDVLEAEDRGDGELRLVIDGPFASGLSPGTDNLVLRASEALRAAADIRSGATLRLTKNLPVASGIGGGSADAAATLRLLAGMWDVDPVLLPALAVGLGSDVPACLVSHTLLARGRGEVLEARRLEELDGMPMLLVNPGVPVATGPVFSGWDSVDRGGLESDSLDAIVAAGRNDLQQPAIAVAPAIAQVLAALESAGRHRLCRMSGSGATCFALYDQARDRDAAADAIAARRGGWWIMKTRIRSS